MQLASLTFFYIFLPACLGLYYLAPRRVRPAVLLVISLAFYALASPIGFFLPVASVLMDLAALSAMARLDQKPRFRRAYLWFSVTKTLVMLIWSGATALQQGSPLMVGVMVIGLSGVDCAVSVYNREAAGPVGPVRLGLYCFFFARLEQGPLWSYPDFESQLEERPSAGVDSLLGGLNLLLVGAVKVLLPGQYLGDLYESLRLYGQGEVSVLSRWVMVFALALSVYYRVSGYCDMAKGMGAMLGYRLPKNFYYPYQSRSVQDFFERFLSTLTAFLRRVVYKPRQKERGNLPADLLSLALVGLLIGAWFGLQTGHLLWGAFLALFAILERHVYPAVLEAVPTLFRRAYTLVVVVLSFALFAGTGAAQSAGYLGDLLGMTGLEFANNRILYLLSTNWPFLVICFFFATNAFSLLVQLLRRVFPKLSLPLTAVSDAVLLALVTALLL